MKKDMRKDRDVESKAGRARFAAALRRAAAAVEAGRAFTVTVGGERVRVPAGASVSVEHEREGAVEELELQFRWRNG